MSYFAIPELLDLAVERDPDKLWLLHGEERFTYREAAERIGTLAAGLADRGVERGSLVLTTARNAPGYLFSWLATARLGAIFVPVDPHGAEAELAGFVEQTAPTWCSRTPSSGAASRRERRRRESGRGRVSPRRTRGRRRPRRQARGTRPCSCPRPGPPGGRSWSPRRTVRTRRRGRASPYWMQLGPEDRLMTSLPLFHVNAPAYSVMGSVAAGASLALLPRFSASRFLDRAREYEATEFNAIGAMLEILMSQPERPDDAHNPLRRCYTGPSPPKKRQLEIEERFGIEIVCGYGLSESTYGLIWPHGQRPFGSLGKPRQHPRLGEVNEARATEGGAEVAVGEVGELELRNPAVMLGYWGMPEETEEALRDDGSLRTGDLVRRDPDGAYTFIGRRKEIIRWRGRTPLPTRWRRRWRSIRTCGRPR